MMKKRFLIYVLLAFLIMVIENVEASHKAGAPPHNTGIWVKIDEADNELWEFHFDSSDTTYPCNIRLKDEDDSSGDDDAEAKGIVGRVVKHLGSYSLKDFSTDCNRNNDACSAIWPWKWKSGMTSKGGDKSLSVSNTEYRPKGDLLCGGDGYWYLCDSNYAGLGYTDTNGLFYRCTSENYEWIQPTEICNNNQDDDADTAADCADSDCYNSPYCNPDINKYSCERLTYDYDDTAPAVTADCVLSSGKVVCNGGTQDPLNPCVCPYGQTKTLTQQCTGTGRERQCVNLYSCTGTAQSINCLSQPCPSGYQCSIPSLNNCCGDDFSDDSAVSVSKYLCDRSGKIWTASSTGKISYLSGSDYEYIFDSSNWIKCDTNFVTTGTQSIINIDDHDYICKGRGQNSIVECCGEQLCKSNGARLLTGESINPSNIVQQPGTCELDAGYVECFDTTDSNCICPYGQTKEQRELRSIDPGTGEEIIDIFYYCSGTPQSLDCRSNPSSCPIGYSCYIPPTPPSTTYYCKDDGTFTDDIDTSQAACENAGFVWTGIKCCGNDIGEYYDDDGTSGGCWNSAFIGSGYKVAGSDVVLNSNGEFYGCKSDNGQSIVEIKDFCTVKGSYYCDYLNNGQWLATNGADKSVQKPLPAAPSNSGCCAAAECWNDVSCVDINSETTISSNVYRCVSAAGVGQWAAGIAKTTPDGTTSGYCTSPTQCLIDPNAANADDQCVESGEYSNDNYCEDGDWSSRTKLLALELLKIKGNAADYTLFCDDKKNTLNHLDYNVIGTTKARQLLESNLDTNNFCVVSFGNNVVIATSINNEITGTSSSVFSDILDVFNIGSCSNNDVLKHDGDFHACDSTNTLWINNMTKSMIYSKNSINFGTGFSFTNLINSIKDAIRNLFSLNVDKLDYLNKVNRFDRLYMSEKSGKAIRGSLYNKFIGNVRTAAIEYSGFTTNVCTLVNEYGNRYNPNDPNAVSGISCKQDDVDSTKFYVLMQGSISTTPNQGGLTNLNPDKIWPDLTSKLRLK